MLRSGWWCWMSVDACDKKHMYENRFATVMTGSGHFVIVWVFVQCICAQMRLRCIPTYEKVSCRIWNINVHHVRIASCVRTQIMHSVYVYLNNWIFRGASVRSSCGPVWTAHRTDIPIMLQYWRFLCVSLYACSAAEYCCSCVFKKKVQSLFVVVRERTGGAKQIGKLPQSK